MDKYKGLEKKFNDIENNFYVRIREEKSRDGFVYYDGFKLTQIKRDGTLKFDDENKKFLRFNSSNIKREDTMKKLKENRDFFYNNYNLSKLVLTKGIVADSYIQSYNEIIDFIKKYAYSYDKDNLTFLFNNLSIEDEREIFNKIYSIKGKKNNKEYYIVSKKEDNYNKSGPQNITMEQLKNNAKKLCSFYEENTKIDLEKKYQHKFLLYKFEKGNLFNKEVHSFEEEYYIDEDNKDGRIDCIFYAAEGNYISDIYLIEIKVDTKVFAGKNGLHKHILDIMNIDNKNDRFYEELIKRINYRNQVLGKYSKYKYKDNFNKHFYFVVGRYEDSIDRIIKCLNRMNNLDKVKGMVKLSGDYEEYGSLPIKDICNEVDGFTIKLFIDQNDNNLDDAFTPVYKDYTDDLFGNINHE